MRNGGANSTLSQMIEMPDFGDSISWSYGLKTPDLNADFSTCPFGEPSSVILALHLQDTSYTLKSPVPGMVTIQ